MWICFIFWCDFSAQNIFLHFYSISLCSLLLFSLYPKNHPELQQQQRTLLQTETEKEKAETEILKQQEKFEMVNREVSNAQKDKENLQSEMEILLDRINKLSELVDKQRVMKKTKSRNFSLFVLK